MRTANRLIPVLLVSALIACGGDLMLPDDGSPAVLQVVSGSGQQGTVGRRLSDPLVVKLTDLSARPIEGVPVVFQFKTDVSDAEIDAQSTTDSEGEASAEVRLGTSTGPHEIEARVASPATLTTVFVVTAVERERGRGGNSDDVDDDDDDD